MDYHIGLYTDDLLKYTAPFDADSVPYYLMQGDDLVRRQRPRAGHAARLGTVVHELLVVGREPGAGLPPLAGDRGSGPRGRYQQRLRLRGPPVARGQQSDG